MGQLVAIAAIIDLSVFNFIGVVLVAVSWAFDGWNNLNFVAGEIKNPRRNLPMALILGTLGVTVLYILTNYIYLYALPVDKMVLANTLIEKPVESLAGIILTLIGIPVYYFWKNKAS